MQLYALDQNKSLASAFLAIKQQDYFCTECAGTVRLRGGMHRQKHFFHVRPNPHCRQNGKSLIHLSVQNYFLVNLPADECILERRFPEINRIADVAWETKKLIFEIQCSPIHAQEVLERNNDYQSLGYTVVWIFHDKTFNRPLFSAAEKALRNTPFFYTNMNENGAGWIYDQFDLFDKGVRRIKSQAIPVDLCRPKPIPQLISSNKCPIFISQRLQNWPLHFHNDLVDIAADPLQNHPILNYIRQKEASTSSQIKQKSIFSLLKQILNNYLIKPYLAIFHLLLEKSCK